MIDVRRDPESLAVAKVQEIVDRAVETGADSVSIEFAQEGGLEVIFMFGNTGFGDILVGPDLEAEVMQLIYDRAGLENQAKGVLHWTSRGRGLKILVEEYDSFGETAYTLAFPKGGQ